MRQHVNPLSRFFQLPLNLPNVENIFLNYNLPIHLDIGCGRGEFLLELASIQQGWNHLGLEIRKPLVLYAESKREKLELENARFFFCNANISLETWLPSLRTDQLRRVSIQFPDPWFKRRHYKRRLLQPSLILALCSYMKLGSELFIQSDIYDLFKNMFNLIEASNCFDLQSKNISSESFQNPYKVRTEREEYVIKQNLPIYRKLYIRNSNSISKAINLTKVI